MKRLLIFALLFAAAPALRAAPTLRVTVPVANGTLRSLADIRVTTSPDVRTVSWCFCHEPRPTSVTLMHWDNQGDWRGMGGLPGVTGGLHIVDVIGSTVTGETVRETIVVSVPMAAQAGPIVKWRIREPPGLALTRLYGFYLDASTQRHPIAPGFTCVATAADPNESDCQAPVPVVLGPGSHTGRITAGFLWQGVLQETALSDASPAVIVPDPMPPLPPVPTGVQIILGSGTPPPAGTGLLADYDFGTIVSGQIPNRVTGAGALPPMQLRGTDVSVANGEMTFNAAIPDPVFVFPFVASRGTFAETATAFPNTLQSGTYAVRVRLDAAATTLGPASSIGLITLRPSPEVNLHSYPPHHLHYYRGGGGTPIYLRAWTGQPNACPTGTCVTQDLAQTQPGPAVIATTPTSFHTYIVTWSPTTLSIWEDGVDVTTYHPLVRTGTWAPGGIVRGLDSASPPNGSLGDHTAQAYTLMVGVQPSLIHSDDQPFLRGTIRALLIYDRALSGADVATLTLTLSRV